MLDCGLEEEEIRHLYIGTLALNTEAEMPALIVVFSDQVGLIFFPSHGAIEILQRLCHNGFAVTLRQIAVVFFVLAPSHLLA